MPRHATVGFDFSGLDHLNLGNGQYRYCIDLLNGLARVETELKFVVIGSQARPPDSIRHAFDGDRWRYVHAPRATFRGAFYLEHARFAWRLRRERIDLLHAPHTFVPFLSGARCVVTVYDLMSEMFPEYRERVQSRPYRLFKHALRRRPCHVIAISQTTADDLQRLWGMPKSQISVVHLGVDVAAPSEQPSAIVRHAAASPFILSPYNLEPRKNLMSLLRAFSEIRRTHPDLRLVLYGRAAVTADREQRFQAGIRELGVDQAVMVTGFVPDAELAFLYREAMLFVFPSLYEGFGLPVLEAMAAGACVVARSQSAMAEILGDTGLQVETREPSLLSAAMRSLLEKPERRAALGEAARVRARRFTQDAMVRGTLAAYMRALGRS